MSESIRAQWKNLPSAFLPQQPNSADRRSLESIDLQQEGPEEDKQSVCIQTLVAGNCKAYIELFYLTHMANSELEQLNPAPADEQTGPQNVSTDSVANKELGLLKQLLSAAEDASRKNEAMQCYEANQQIAELFEDGRAWEAAQTYYEKCLRIAKDCGNTEAEATAYCRLGQLHESAGNNSAGLEHHEKYLALANANGMEDESAEALKSLVGTYMVRAEEMEAAGELNKAVEYYECCIKSAQECYDAHSEGTANHRLGKLWLQLEQNDKAIGHQKAYLEYCNAPPEDKEGIVAASASLADAYHAAGDVDEAVSNLRLCLEIAESTQSLEAQTQACNNLGLIYMKQDNFVKAVECFQRNFEIACSIGGKALIDNAKVNLGVAKGKSKMGKFMDLVCKDLPSLIQWKNNRTKLT